MKKITHINYFIGALFVIAAASGCKKSFLEKPPLSSIVDANFYKNDEQLLSGTSLLYSEVWFDYNDKAMYNLGDFRGGSAFSAWNDRGNVLFNTTGDNGENGASWRAFFTVVAQSNMAIYNINKYAGEGVTAKARKMAIAEARFMRALAYRFLVMNWGPVPIIENNLDHLNDTLIRRNTITSVWRFITREMRAARDRRMGPAIQENLRTRCGTSPCPQLRPRFEKDSTCARHLYRAYPHAIERSVQPQLARQASKWPAASAYLLARRSSCAKRRCASALSGRAFK